MNQNKQHPALLFTGKLISYIFHPLFIPTYIFFLLIRIFPFEFAGINPWELHMKTFSVFWMTAFFPGFAVFLMWKLKLIENMYLRTQKERIIPFFISMFFYWWMYYLSRNFTDQPIVLKFFYFGIFISTSIGVVINNFIKISLHGMAMGGALTAIIFFSIYYQAPISLVIIAAVFLTGLVSTARLLVSNHTVPEVYIGLLVGAICQIAAYYFIL